jgi:glutamate/tyrosine decarboxylase-like PLP-dependent enzyme
MVTDTGPDLLNQAARQAIDYLSGLPERHVGADADPESLRRLLGGALPDDPVPGSETLGLLERAAAEGGVVASSGPRYFGYVVGGTLPVALATDWIVSTWDQNTGVYNLGPAVATAEQVAADWLVDLLGLPLGTSVGFPTGCTMAHLTALAAARHELLAKAGWDVESGGLQGAPKLEVVVGAQRHLSIDLALRYLGIGTDQIRVVPADEQGRMRVEQLEAVVAACTGQVIVCAQVGDLHSGAIDPVQQICAVAHRYAAWVHVDGAFGLWARASPAMRHLVAGVEDADSWASDAHKWLNTPYDCGLVFVARPDAHRGAMLDTRAGYLPAPGTEFRRDGIDWVPDFSRRARSLPVWAALRTLGRSGVAQLVDGCCAQARRFAAALAQMPDVEVLNEVVLNQVMVRFGDDDGITSEVIDRLQAGGVCWFGGTTWNGKTAMRVSVTSWQTTAADVDRSVEAIGEAIAASLTARTH